MPVCIKCGSELKPSSKFCGMCGQPVQQTTQHASQNTHTQNTTVNQPSEITCLRCGKKHKTVDKLCCNCGCPNPPPDFSKRIWTREEYIAELDRMLAYFSKVQPWYDQYYALLRARQAKDLDEIKEQEYRRRKYNDDDLFDFLEFLFVWNLRKFSVLLFVLSGLLLIAIIFIFAFVEWPASLLIGAGSFLLSGVLCYIGVLILQNESKKKANIRNEYKQLNAQVNSTFIYLRNYYKNYGYCILGSDDTDPRKIKMIRDYMISGQAKTVESARKMANKRFHETYPI